MDISSASAPAICQCRHGSSPGGQQFTATHCMGRQLRQSRFARRTAIYGKARLPKLVVPSFCERSEAQAGKNVVGAPLDFGELPSGLSLRVEDSRAAAPSLGTPPSRAGQALPLHTITATAYCPHPQGG